MANVTIAGGAEIDIASAAEVRQYTDDVVSRLRPAPRPRAIRRTPTMSGVMPAAGALVLDLGGPPSNAMWSVTSVVVTGSDDRTAVAAGVAVLYLGGEAQATPSLLNLLKPGSTAIPVDWTFSKDTIFAHAGDNLFVLVYGAAPGTNLMAVARVHEWSPASMQEIVSM